jgi:hypothetical protein
VEASFPLGRVKHNGLRGCLKCRLRVTDHRRVMPITINTDKLYDTDLTDAAWALIAPMLPAARSGGGPRTTNIRAVLNAIFYLLRLPAPQFLVFCRKSRPKSRKITRISLVSVALYLNRGR